MADEVYENLANVVREIIPGKGLSVDIFDKFAMVIYEARKPLKPLENPEDVPMFNYLRRLSANLCDAFDARNGFEGFNYQRFLSIAMTGEPT